MSVQGDFREHMETLDAVGAVGREVRLPGDLDGVDGLILPGGESTAMRKLYLRWNLVAPIKKLASRGAPILGTCAGAILLATRIADGDEPVLSLVDMEVRRNAFGRQLDSFETELTMQSLKATGADTSLRAVFIRAPEIVSVGPAASVVARLTSGEIVAARQGSVVAISFHPEIAGETRLHRWLADQAASAHRA